MHEHEDKEIKITVKYAGKIPDLEHNYLPSDLVSQVKAKAMDHFKITAKGSDYCLQFEDKVLGDSMTLEQAGIEPSKERTVLELVARDDSDTDGWC